MADLSKLLGNVSRSEQFSGTEEQETEKKATRRDMEKATLEQAQKNQEEARKTLSRVSRTISARSSDLAWCLEDACEVLFSVAGKRDDGLIQALRGIQFTTDETIPDSEIENAQILMESLVAGRELISDPKELKQCDAAIKACQMRVNEALRHHDGMQKIIKQNEQEPAERLLIEGRRKETKGGIKYTFKIITS